MLKAAVPKMIDEIAEAFEQAKGHKAKAAKTPGFPGKMLQKCDGDPVLHAEFRSITGKLLCHMTKVGPEMANWWSKKQTAVALSSAESEICSCSLCAGSSICQHTVDGALWREADGCSDVRGQPRMHLFD